MNSNLLRFIELASNAGLLEPVQSDRQLNSSPISNMDNLVHREISLSLGDVNKLQTPNTECVFDIFSIILYGAESLGPRGAPSDNVRVCVASKISQFFSRQIDYYA